MSPQKVVNTPMTGTVYTSLESLAIFQEAAAPNNEALRLSRAGDLAGAERLHLKALDVKLRNMGPTAFSTSISYNELGETYLKMRELEKAESNLKKAIEIRSMYPTYAFDAAVSREYLAQVYEMRGDLVKAKKTRLSAGKLSIACAYHMVRHTVLKVTNYDNKLRIVVLTLQCSMTTFKKKELSNCGRCRVSAA